jgi:hypothetical protein
MTYQQPTLFGVVYASRLFREVDESSQAYQAFRRETAPSLAMASGDNNGHVAALLVWLNKWGCRITKNKFEDITVQLIEWFEKWSAQLPSRDSSLAHLTETHLDTFASAYHALLAVDEFGPTSAAKTLFATRPHAAMPWDAAIQDGFKLSGRSPQKYRALLSLSQNEAQALAADARRHGVTAKEIPQVSGDSDQTIPWLLDKYHWITLTRRHHIPDCQELTRWVGWACS